MRVSWRGAAALALLAVMLLSSAAPVAAAAAAGSTGGQEAVAPSRPYVHPLLRSKGFWERGVVGGGLYDQVLAVREVIASKLEAAGLDVATEREWAQILVLVPASAPEVARRVAGMLWASEVFPAGSYLVVTGWATRSTVDLLAETTGVAAVLPSVALDYMAAVPDPRGLAGLGRLDPDVAAAREAARAELREALAADAEPAEIGGVFHYTVNLTRAVEAWQLLNTTGELARIAIIDTGVDYASPGLGEDAVARGWDYFGLWDNVSLILDDGLGLVLTPVKVEPITVADNGTLVYVNTSMLYYFMPFFDMVIYWNMTLVGSGYGLTYWNVSEYWVVPDYVNVSEARFGIAERVIFVPGLSFVVFPVPVLVYDSMADNDSLYDAVLLDLSTAYAVFYQALNETGALDMLWYVPPPPPGAPDYSFADEAPVYYGGNEIAALDLDGDGFYDFSAGTLAGYLHDTLGVVLLEYQGVLASFAGQMPGSALGVFQLASMWIDLWGFEPHADVWPGFDRYEGRWVTLSYDFHSHGTFCATTAAGRPVPAYVGYGDTGWKLVAGQAPSAKIAAAPALYMGDVLAALYFFSGFLPWNPYGFYAGNLTAVGGVAEWVNFTGVPGLWLLAYYEPLVDLTSNSWGVSGWQLWGWASGLDPLSIVVDYTTTVTGITHFIAAGNGGPGWGTVAVPGAAAFAVTVGAATEFTYRPFYGYLPGGNREIVSWSNRGPAETGVAKPDVAAIGSFAYAVGRPWDSLSWGVLTGALAFDLFGGTSQATPMTAGVAALVVSYIKKAFGMPADAFAGYKPILKTALMLGSSDTGFDPLSQGAGFVDAVRAAEKAMAFIELIYRLDGYPANVTSTLALSTSVAMHMERVGGDSYNTMTYCECLRDYMRELLSGDVFDKLWMAEPKLVFSGAWGSVAKAKLLVAGTGRMRIYGVYLDKALDVPLARAPGVMVATGDAVRLSGNRIVVDFSRLDSTGMLVLARINPDVLLRYDMVEIAASYPLKFFDPTARGDYSAGGVFYNGLELWYWIDLNRDGQVQPEETARIQYDLRSANAFHLQVAKLGEQLQEIERLVALHLNVSSLEGYHRELLLVYRYWDNGWSGGDPVPALFDVRLRGYVWRQARLTALPSRLSLSGGAATVTLFMRMPPPGIYAGYVVVENLDTGEKLRIPFTVVSAAKVSYVNRQVVVSSRLYRYAGLNDLYMNGMLRGAFDWTWRYESGDWRVIPVMVTNSDIKYMVVEVKWPVTEPRYASNLDVAVYGRYTYRLVYADDTAVPRPAYAARVTGLQLGGELTVDFTGYWDDPYPGLSRIIVPISEPGLYLVVVRNIEYSGASVAEPFDVVLRPVSLYTWPSTPWVRETRPGLARLFIRAAGYMDFSGLSVSGLNETFVKGYYGYDWVTGYTADMAWYNYSVISVETLRKSYWSWSRLSLAYMLLRLSYTGTGAEPGGTYVVPLSLETGVPVWSVGYVWGGYTLYEYRWYSLPLQLTVKLVK